MSRRAEFFIESRAFPELQYQYDSWATHSSEYTTPCVSAEGMAWRKETDPCTRLCSGAACDSCTDVITSRCRFAGFMDILEFCRRLDFSGIVPEKTKPYLFEHSSYFEVGTGQLQAESAKLKPGSRNKMRKAYSPLGSVQVGSLPPHGAQTQNCKLPKRSMADSAADC